MTNAEDDLERRTQRWERVGKRREDITWGMLQNGFQSLAGIPDDFYSAEDPSHREELWDRYLREQASSGDSGCDCGGGCQNCDPMYKD